MGRVYGQVLRSYAGWANRKIILVQRSGSSGRRLYIPARKNRMMKWSLSVKSKTEKSAYRPIRCSHELDETLGRLAAQQHTSKSEVLRDLVDRGLVSLGAKPDDDYLYGLVQRAVKETVQPQIERLAAISAKATHVAAASFFMGVYAAMKNAAPAEQREIEEAAGSARELGIQFLKLKDRDIDAFIRNGVKAITEEDSNE